ncbi:MAG: ABC transporter substrate-binding protein [Coxiellaceae bacterium]|nr:ABC transporter substrate-binding protein [Coxiellaceae bacterium]MDP1950528.1 ABC transporter substrate-binding protein [Nitrosomonas sp.]
MKVILKIKSILLVLAVVAMLSVMSLSWAETTSSESPEETVRHLQAALLQVMREGEALGYQGRFDLLAPVVNQSHDFGFIIRTILGSNWTELDQEQQRIITEIFSQLSVATYAEQFKEYDGEQFEILEQRSFPQDHIEVRTHLIKADKGTVDLRYLLKQRKTGWHIVNIVAEGVSELAIKRTEYRAILQRDGFSALVEMLRQKILQAERS